MRYFAELRNRPSRALTGILSIAMGVALFVSLQAYADGYRQAARAPLVEVGADLTAQRQGAVPDKFEGMVFPHSVAPIRQNEIDQIRQLPGVQGIAPVLFFWSFEPNGFVAGLGLDPADTFGPGRLQAAISAGRFLQPNDHGVAVADTTYAQQNKLALGSVVTLDGQAFTIVGLADTSRAGQLANANLYIPLADARALANVAPQVRSVFDIRPDDANLLFIKADQTRVDDVAARVKAILGDKAIVSSAQSFAAELGALFALIDRFGLLVGLIAFLFAAALLLRVVAASVWERRREIAVMRTVGWRRREVMRQLWSETLVLVVIGWLVGLALAVLAHRVDEPRACYSACTVGTLAVAALFARRSHRIRSDGGTPRARHARIVAMGVGTVDRQRITDRAVAARPYRPDSSRGGITQ